MKQLEWLRNRAAAFTHDLLMVPVAWLGAFWLRFNLGVVPEESLECALTTLPIIMTVQACAYWYFGLYRGIWRFASVPDLMRIIKAVIICATVAMALIFLLNRLEEVPRSVFPLYGLLLVVFLGGPRLIYRGFKERQLYVSAGRQRILIVGAGRAGEMLVRDLFRDRTNSFYPIGFVDDNPANEGREVQGVLVRGYCEVIPALVASMGVDLVLIAIPSANSSQMRRVVSLCEEAGVTFRTLPKFQDLVSGRSTVSDLREVSIEDLLGREPVSLDWASIRAGVGGRKILVSGGGGSIGSELCRQIAGCAPHSLLVLDNSEFNLYTIEIELKRQFPNLLVKTMLTDVRDAKAVIQTFGEFKPDMVFHAAAYKHVPLLEYQACAAVRNNVGGTRNVINAAMEVGCGTFVLISTDKAVNPANVMGASKRAAEIVCQLADRRGSGTHFITVRFGNVLDSAGSVVPLFRRQIAQGGPVTVTDPEVTRYFMTIPEACQLIMEAGTVGKSGEVYVLDMGDPVKISYLAEQMIVLAGKVPGEDIELKYTGLRPGEKLFEELFHESENLTTTDHPKLLLARYRDMDLAQIESSLEHLLESCESHDEAALMDALGRVVPEFNKIRFTSNEVDRNAISLDNGNVVEFPGSLEK